MKGNLVKLILGSGFIFCESVNQNQILWKKFVKKKTTQNYMAALLSCSLIALPQ